MTDDYISPLQTLALLIVTCETAFRCVVVSQARHFVLPFCEGFSTTLAQSSRPNGSSFILQQCCQWQCAPSHDWTFLELSLFSLIPLTWYCQYRSWPEQKHTYFVSSWLCVSSFPHHRRVTHIEHFYIHKVQTGGARLQTKA